MAGPRRRVFVTGMGLVSPHGGDPAAAFDRLYAGESAVRKVFSGSAESGNDVLMAAAEFDPSGLIPKAQLFAMDRVAQMAVVAAHRALNSAGLLAGEHGPADAGTYMGCALGGAQALQDAYGIYFLRRSRKVKPTSVPLIMPNASAAHVSMRYRLLGPSFTYSVACASSAIAIGEAFRAVRDGYLERALAGGTEAMLNDGSVVAWESLGVLAKEHPDGPAASSRPFAADRTGFVLGEGAAMLMLESEQAVRSRGAQPLAEIVGFGASSDARNLTQPAADGQVRAMRLALGGRRDRPGRDRLHQCARNGDPGRRQGRDRRGQGSLRAARARAGHQRHQIDARAPGRCGRGAGVRHHDPGAAAAAPAPHCESHRARSRLRPRLRTRPRARSTRAGVRAVELVRVRRLQRGPHRPPRLICRPSVGLPEGEVTRGPT